MWNLIGTQHSPTGRSGWRVLSRLWCILLLITLANVPPGIAGEPTDLPAASDSSAELWQTVFDVFRFADLGLSPPHTAKKPTETKRTKDFLSRELLAKGMALSRLDTEYQTPATSQQGEITRILSEIDELEQRYLNTLEKTRSDYGIYLVGKYDEDLRNSEERYFLKAEWRLFNDGYFEAVRTDAKKMLQTRLEFFQMRRDMLERSLEDQLYLLTTVENLVQLRKGRTRSSLLRRLLTKREKQLQSGYTTTLDVLNIRRQLEEAQRAVDTFEQMETNGLPGKVLELLNSLEYLDLTDESSLVDTATINSLDLKIQDTFIERSHFFRRWSDNFALNLNAGYQHEFFDLDRELVGIELELPLTFNRHRKELVRTQKRIYQYQKEAVAKRLRQKLRRLRAMFTFQQKILRDRQAGLLDTLQELQLNEQRRSLPIQTMEADPDRIRDQLLLDLVDLRFDCQLVRLKLYEIILKLLAESQVPAVTDLFVFPSSGSPDHSVEPSQRPQESW